MQYPTRLILAAVGAVVALGIVVGITVNTSSRTETAGPATASKTVEEDAIVSDASAPSTETVSGIVVDDETGYPIPRVLIWESCGNNPGTTALFFTDTEGKFQVDPASVGACFLQAGVLRWHEVSPKYTVADAVDGVLTIRLTRRPVGTQGTNTFLLPTYSGCTTALLHKSARTTLTGRLVNVATGEPIPGYNIVFQSDSLADGTRNSEGFSFEYGGRTTEVRAYFPDYDGVIPQDTFQFVIPQGCHTDVTIPVSLP